MSKKVLITALAGIAAISLSSAALAQNFHTSNSDIYVGGQVGYADTNWSDIGFNSDANVGGRVFLGFDFNQYLALETGFFYTPAPRDLGGAKANTFAGDVVGKITVPVTERLGLFAKAGPGYLRTQGRDSASDNISNVDLVYGFGANYKITPNLVADISFTRYNGNHDASDVTFDNVKYQPNTDLYALGLAYKFNV